MAQTAEEIKGQLDAAGQILSVAKTNLDNAPLLQRKFYQSALDVAQASFDKIKGRYDAAYKAEADANQASRDAAEARVGARQPLIDRAEIDVRSAKKYLNSAKDSGDTTRIAARTAELAKAEANLAAIKSGAKASIVKVGNTSRTELVVETTGTMGSPVSVEQRNVAQVAAEEEAAARTASDTALGYTVKIENKNGAQVKVTTDPQGNATETPVVATVTDTTTPTTVATTKKKTTAKTGKQAIAPATDWEGNLRKFVPSKAWMLDLDRTKYPGLFTLLKTASDQNYYSSDEGRVRFLNELDSTDFFKELADSSQRRDIKKLVGDLGFDSTDFSKFVSDSINFGWEGETLKAKTYEQVFSKNIDGSYANPLAVQRAQKSNDYLRVQLTAKAYFNNASQESIERVLTGQINSDDFARQQRTIAKQTYGHLSELIDQGVTLDDLATNYKKSASALLEIDPNAIDMSAADFEVALSYGEEGKKRTMTTGEWEKMLRTDPRYGWEKTNNAKAEARSLASNIAQAFGRII
jgi:hypothetical protein